MGPPFVLLLGFVALFGAQSLDTPLPGSGSFAEVAAWLPLWALPSLLSLVGLHRLRRRLLRGECAGLHPRFWLRIAAGASPAVVYLVASVGGWLDLASQWAGDSHLLSLLLLATPLAVIELPRHVMAAVGHAWLEGDTVTGAGARRMTSLPSVPELWPLIRLRLGWPLLLTMPGVLMGGGLDLLSLHRELYGFCLGTSSGATLAMLVLLLLFGLTLPFWFRIAFGLVRELPEPNAAMLRQTAAKLGFSPSRVMQLPTGDRALNAMMVGPLPFGRILCITDGLLQTLDGDLLTGVIAHEVGHARMEHPGLLLLLAGVVPLFLMSPISMLDHACADAWWLAFAMVMTVVFAWSAVRALARRFEHEADVASVRAFGAGPCSRALLAVAGAAAPLRHGWFGRFTSLHPDEPARCATMLRYELEPRFRAEFDQAGRRLRWMVAAVLAVSMAAAVVTWRMDWRFEQVVWRLSSGDVVGALALDAEIQDPVPERWRRTWRDLRGDLAAAAEIAPGANDWAMARPRFADVGWRRGIEVLLEKGPAAARPYFALVATSGGDDWLVRRQLYEFCRAAADEDPPRMDAMRRLLQKRGFPPELAPVFGE